MADCERLNEEPEFTTSLPIPLWKPGSELGRSSPRVNLVQSLHSYAHVFCYVAVLHHTPGFVDLQGSLGSFRSRKDIL